MDYTQSFNLEGEVYFTIEAIKINGNTFAKCS